MRRYGSFRTAATAATCPRRTTRPWSIGGRSKDLGTEKTAFGVVVPDLPGCFSAGDTTEEVFDNVREGIEARCEMLSEDGREVLQPKPMSHWRADPEYAGWTWGIVEVPVERFFGPAEKLDFACRRNIE